MPLTSPITKQRVGWDSMSAAWECLQMQTLGALQDHCIPHAPLLPLPPIKIVFPQGLRLPTFAILPHPCPAPQMMFVNYFPKSELLLRGAAFVVPQRTQAPSPHVSLHPDPYAPSLPGLRGLQLNRACPLLPAPFHNRDQEAYRQETRPWGLEPGLLFEK